MTDESQRQIPGSGPPRVIGRDITVGDRVPVNPGLAFGVAPELAQLLSESAPAQPFDYRPLVSIQAGGVLYTEYADTIKRAEYPRLTRWQRLRRKLTPPRWRKPLLPIANDPVSRAQRMNANILRELDKLGVLDETLDQLGVPDKARR